MLGNVQVLRPERAASGDGELAEELAGTIALNDPSAAADEDRKMHAGRADPPQTPLVVAALQHVHSDLLFHAEERNVYMRYFLVVFGALATGVVHAYEIREFGFATVAAVLSAAVSGIFLLMDVRHVSRIQVALEAVTKLQSVIADQIRLPEFRLANRARSRLGAVLRLFGVARFFSPIQTLFWIGLLMSVGAFCLSIEGVKADTCPLAKIGPSTAQVCGYVRWFASDVENVAPFLNRDPAPSVPPKAKPTGKK